MNTQQAYRQKMEAEVELAQAKLAELKAEAKNFAADARIKYAGQIEKLEQGLDTTKARLKEMSDAGDENWERFKDGVESAWGSVNVAVRDTAAKFKQ